MSEDATMPDPSDLGAQAQKRFFLLLGIGVPVLLGLAFLWHSCATRGGATMPAQGKLVRRSDGSPVAGAVLYASETPVLVLSRDPKASDSVVLGGTQANPLHPLGKSGPDGSFRIEVPHSSGATVLAVHGELAAALARVSDLKTAEEAGGIVLESPCSLRGETYDSAGSPLVNAFVSLVPYGGKEKPHWQTWTDGEGKFRFSKLPAGRLAVSVIYPRIADPVNVEFTASAVVSVEAGQESSIRFGPSGALIGKVRDEEGKPIPHAEIQVRATGFTAEGRLAAHLRTRESGDFKIYGLPPTSYRAFIRNPERGEDPAWFDAGEIGFPRSQERWTDLTVSSGLLKFRLAPQSAEYPLPTVLPEKNRAAVRRFLLFPKDSNQPSYDLTSEMRVSAAEDKGIYDPKMAIFYIRNVPPGRYTAVCQVEEYGSGVEEDIEVNPQEKAPFKTISVIRGGPVTVKVTDPQGKPIPHAIVSLWWEDKLEFVRGGPGEELSPGPGNFLLRVEADGYRTHTEKFYVLVASRKDFSVKLEPEKE